MSDDERRREEEEGAGRPRVVDKRISARGTADAPPPSPTPEPDPSPDPPDPGHPPEPDLPPEPGPGPSGPSRIEVPGAPAAEEAPGPAPEVTPEMEAEARQMAEEIARTQAKDWVINSAVTLANVAATKVQIGQVEDARIAIDSLAALLEAVGPRLDDAEAPLRQMLAQLQLLFAQRSQPPA